eukprot:Skav219838  [mRNA]  locus=scaffold859:200459:206221:+ [translate_table: standard]
MYCGLMSKISHLLLRAGPPKEFEVLRPGPPQPTVRRLAFEESSKVSPRTAVPSRPPKSEAPIPDGAAGAPWWLGWLGGCFVTSMCSGGALGPDGSRRAVVDGGFMVGFGGVYVVQHHKLDG